MVVRSLTAPPWRSPSSPSAAPEGANDKTPNSVEAASIAASRVRGKLEESLESILKPPLVRRMRRKAATFLRCSAFSWNGQHATPPACRSPDTKPRGVSTSERMDTKKALEKKSPQLALRAGFRSATCYRSIIIVIAAFIAARDPPDRPGARNLHLGLVSLVKLTSSTSWPADRLPFSGEKPKSPSHDTSTAFFFTTPTRIEFLRSTGGGRSLPLTNLGPPSRCRLDRCPAPSRLPGRSSRLRRSQESGGADPNRRSDRQERTGWKSRSEASRGRIPKLDRSGQSRAPPRNPQGKRSRQART